MSSEESTFTCGIQLIQNFMRRLRRRRRATTHVTALQYSAQQLKIRHFPANCVHFAIEYPSEINNIVSMTASKSSRVCACVLFKTATKSRIEKQTQNQKPRVRATALKAHFIQCGMIPSEFPVLTGPCVCLCVCSGLFRSEQKWSKSSQL